MQRTIFTLCFAGLVLLSNTPGQPFKEALLSESENAYNTIPNQDGSLIAYVRTGWGREGGSGGFGRSNLRSEVMVMNADGTLLTRKPLVDAFLSGWTPDGKNLICYRDLRYFLISATGETIARGQLPNTDRLDNRSERVSYLSGVESPVWIQNDSREAFIQTPRGKIARYPGHLGELIIPSPDEKYIAVTSPQNSFLRVYDMRDNSWSDLGAITIHPNSEWDYIKPSWNPWFSDSARLAFISGSSLIISSPDGRDKQIVADVGSKAGLAVPAPDGELIAYATFEDRPMKMRQDLKFWGGSTLWVVPTVHGAKAYPVTGKHQDTTYCLRWLDNKQLVFDRIADESFYRRARLWKAQVSR
jgi:hypothetical protein